MKIIFFYHFCTQDKDRIFRFWEHLFKNSAIKSYFPLTENSITGKFIKTHNLMYRFIFASSVSVSNYK